MYSHAALMCAIKWSSFVDKCESEQANVCFWGGSFVMHVASATVCSIQREYCIFQADEHAMLTRCLCCRHSQPRDVRSDKTKICMDLLWRAAIGEMKRHSVCCEVVDKSILQVQTRLVLWRVWRRLFLSPNEKNLGYFAHKPTFFVFLRNLGGGGWVLGVHWVWRTKIGSYECSADVNITTCVT